ncbi:MAG: DUF4132 domain-containing protein [Oscillospiraceae bacterium]|nr:DUF4132 domain-containing protein [Oscillospiraceae bacterium]
MGKFDIQNDEMLSYVSASRSKKGEDVVVPDGIMTIGKYGFSDDRNGNINSIFLPEGVTTIKEQAFVECGLRALHVPGTLKSVGKKAFARCKNFKYIFISGDNISWLNGNQEIPQSVAVIQNGKKDLKILACSMKNKNCNLPPQNTAEYWEDYDREIIENGPQFKFTTPVRLLGAIGRLMDPVELGEDKKQAYIELLAKNIKHLIPVVEELKMPDLIQILFTEGVVNNKNQVAVKKLLSESKIREIAAFAKIETTSKEPAVKKKAAKKSVQSAVGLQYSSVLSEKEWAQKLTLYYATDIKQLPPILDKEKKELTAAVKVWLLTAHEKTVKHPWNEIEVLVDYEKPGLCSEAREVIDQLNQESLQKALRKLAETNLGIKAKNKKMYLAYPICRYADETLMEELTKQAPEWRSQVSGINAPSLLTFRKANAYSETRAAMVFADKYKDTSWRPEYLDMETYAQLRGTDADTIRDKYLSDVGLNEKGGKIYDLGNQTVTVRLQKDLGFIVELPTGKTAKSLPKKGADAEKFAVANANFSELKKNVKKIAKNRVNILFADFFSGRTRPAADWKESTLSNPLLRQVASLLVWTQNGKTFTLTDTGVITADETTYTIGDTEIALAHPMDMSQTDLAAWQKYFATNGIKQPFEQIWEPVVDAASVMEDRYKDCMIPYHRFAGKTKHGIHVEDTDFHNSIYIYFDDCKADVKRIDQMRHAIEMDHRFEVRSISFEKFTRKVNHIIAYLDRVTIVERIKKDDAGIASFLPGFTLAQITEFIKVATENNCTNVTALLLDYKNQNFADVDPMEEFSLDL